MLHYNMHVAPAHLQTWTRNVDTLQTLRYEALEYPPYSRGLAPFDYYVLSPPKDMPRERILGEGRRK